MNSFKEIDDKNFVYMMETDLGNELDFEDFSHSGFKWNLTTTPDDPDEFTLKCLGPDDGLWEVDATVTASRFKQDGTKTTERTLNGQFNRRNLTMDDVVAYDHEKPVKIHVKINSITGVQHKNYAKFDKEDEQLSDVALVVEGKKLFVNKAVLATFSPVFRAMFFSSFKESTDKEVVINDVKYEEFEDFLHVIYSSSDVLHAENIHTILMLADRYDVQIVKERCENYLLYTDSVSTIEILKLAEKYTFPKVHEECIASLYNKEDVKQLFTEKHQLRPNTLQEIIQKLLNFKDCDDCTPIDDDYDDGW